MYTSINASRAYVYAVARACDRGQISRRVSKTRDANAGGSLFYTARTALVLSSTLPRKP